MDPTPSIVSGLWKHMTQHFNTTVINKSSSTEMQLVSSLLGALHIVDQQSFLNQYTTTLGRRIYAPFTPGVSAAANGWSLWAQTIVCAHEHEHVVQLDRLGPITFDYRYLTDTPSRTRLEAEAYRSSLELNWWHTKTLPEPAALAGLLRGYGVTDTDVAMAGAILAASAEAVKHGAIMNQASAVAIAWLNANAPELRAS